MVYTLLVAAALFVMGGAALSQTARSKAAHFDAAAAQQPVYDNYKGVRIGMTADEARARLGAPTQKSDDQDFYIFSPKETAQVCYNLDHKVVTISIDYQGEDGGAPDYKAVVGTQLDVRPDGSLYKLVRYEQLGFWVSYFRTASTNPVPVITITIQKNL
jgi:hypothetical protein